MNKLFIPGRRLLQPPRGIQVLKHAEVIAVKEICRGNLLVILAHCLRFLGRSCFGKTLTELERSGRFQPGEIVEIIALASFSIRSCKISLLIFLRGSSLSNVGLCFE